MSGGTRVVSLRRRMRAIAPALLLLLVCLTPLAGCARIDPWMRDGCVAALPGLEPEDATIVVTGVETVGERGEAIRVDYRSGEGKAAHDHEIACAFAEDPATGLRDLVGIRTEQGILPVARFFVLKRFWLGDDARRAAGLARVSIAASARPRALVTLDAAAGLRLQQLLDALAPAALYALLGLAATLVIGLVGRLLVFFGDLSMLGAFAALTAAVAVLGGGGADPLIAVPITLIAASVVVGLWGGTIGRTVVVPLALRSPTPILVAAVGLSVALQEFVARARGVDDLWLAPPAGRPILVADGPFEVFVTPMRLVLVAAALAAVAAVVTILPRTRFGREWRAVADDAATARLFGIEPERVLRRTCALAGVLAGLAGAAEVLAWGGTSFHMGTVLGVKAVLVAVLGGIGSLPGAALAGVLIGFVEAGWTAVWGADWRDVAVFGLLVAVLPWRRDGLLGTDGDRA